MVSDDFPRPYAVQFPGSAVFTAVLAALGWSVRFHGLPARQGVFVIYPHTSNWDVVFLLLAKWALGIPVWFWAKQALFQVPVLSTWLRWIGGVPVNRISPHGVVGQAVQQFARARSEDRLLWLALTPEGTRKRLAGWRSGFYQTVLQTGVPLGLVSLDYGRREVSVTSFLQVSGNVDDDFRRMARAFDGVVGRNAHNASPICLLDPAVPRSETVVK